MWFATLADIAVKSTLVLAIAWMAALSLRTRSAAARHSVWTAAAAALLALPILALLLPKLPMRAAAAVLPGVVFQTTATAEARSAGSIPFALDIAWPSG